MNDQRHPHETETILINNRTDAEVDVHVRHEDGREVIEVDIVDVEKCGRENLPPPPARRYRVKIDREYHVFDKRVVMGGEILERAGKVPVSRFELEMGLHGAGFVAVEPDERIDLGRPGIEVFQTFPLDEQEG